MTNLQAIAVSLLASAVAFAVAVAIATEIDLADMGESITTTFGKTQIQPNVMLLLKTQTQSNTVLLLKTHTQPTQPTRAPPQSSPKPPRPKATNDLNWSVRDERDMDRIKREG